ncbi:MAG TPA: hypothetical protein PK573_12140 [Spirochaetota bacterium]|nr:hypothetical protein [Spirochaetota bacterium]HRZ27277.1 hypothetical protein [Spirochaetota bacterium]HSA14473.1 hypothetical protein [Spirochaetota bacterium]
MEKMKIGQILVKGGVINEKQLKFALEKQEREGGRIGDILISLGFITDREVIKALTEQASDE